MSPSRLVREGANRLLQNPESPWAVYGGGACGELGPAWASAGLVQRQFTLPIVPRARPTKAALVRNALFPGVILPLGIYGSDRYCNLFAIAIYDRQQYERKSEHRVARAALPCFVVCLAARRQLGYRRIYVRQLGSRRSRSRSIAG